MKKDQAILGFLPLRAFRKFSTRFSLVPDKEDGYILHVVWRFWVHDGRFEPHVSIIETLVVCGIIDIDDCMGAAIELRFHH